MNKFIKSSSNITNWLETDSEVCFIGRSNVGKSSLLNAIFKEKIARVSKTPGRTRLINFFSKNENVIVDLPGYGYAKISKTAKHDMDRMVEHYFKRREQLIMTFVLIDTKIGVTPMDDKILQFLKFWNKRFFVVATKKDKCKQSEIYKTTQQIKKYVDDFLIVSAMKKINIDKLDLVIENCFNE